MFEEIKDADLEKRSMRNVATTPTRPTPFGESRFSADDLKGRFDLLPKYLATKINEILSALPNGNLANATKTLGGESVGWFIDGLVGGYSASKVKIVTPTEELTLKEAVTRLVKLLDEIDNGELLNILQLEEGKTLRAVILDLENKTKELNESLDSKVSDQTLNERIAAIVGSAPETLNALNELAAALGNDPNFATTVANQIGAKASKKELQETESAILEGLGAILAAQEEILGGSV